MTTNKAIEIRAKIQKICVFWTHAMVNAVKKKTMPQSQRTIKMKREMTTLMTCLSVSFFMRKQVRKGKKVKQLRQET